MIHDLMDVDCGCVELTADVVVVGAGIAGLLMAQRLHKAGRKVLVLESGARSQSEDQHPLNEVVMLGQKYTGADQGRFRCLGGTSTRWGGAMLPFWPDDMGEHTAGWDVHWPVSYDQVIGYLDDIERLFRLPGGPFVVADQMGLDESDNPEAYIRSGKWPIFGRRNVATLLEDTLALEGLDVWLNATACEFELNENGGLRTVTARAPSGSEIHASAPHFVIASGAIESTRLLLLMDAQNDDRIFGNKSALGRYFFDHVIVNAATVVPRDLASLIEATGWRFESGGMRDTRLEPSPHARHRHGLPAGYSFIKASPTRPGGFDALRSAYRKLQRRALPDLEDAMGLVGDASWLARAVWWRFVKNKLLAPADAQFNLFVVAEQKPDVDNSITLTSDKRDIFGQPLAAIDWHIRQADIDSVNALARFFCSMWSRTTLSQSATFELRGETDLQALLAEEGDIRHPGGSTRMGSNAKTAVVDSDLRCFGVRNVRVVSTSIFPSGGGSNPTLMLMLFALRAADSIDRSLSAVKPRIRSGSTPAANLNSGLVSREA